MAVTVTQSKLKLHFLTNWHAQNYFYCRKNDFTLCNSCLLAVCGTVFNTALLKLGTSWNWVSLNHDGTDGSDGTDIQSVSPVPSASVCPACQ